LNGIADYDFSISNEELLDQCKRQDNEALRVLFRRHERPVFNLLYRMLSNYEDAEEALAEVFVKVWRSASSFKGDAKFTTWLYKIATNTARDMLRSRKSRNEVSAEEVIEQEVEAGKKMSNTTLDPVEAALQAEEQALLVGAMARLSEEERLLVTLYHFQDSNYQEIAQITGIPMSNLKVKLFRARQRLRALYAQQESGDTDEMRAHPTEPPGLREGSAEWA
jgi:RNA polymerase sigma-70 factor (ECF subfamily)